MKTFRDWPIKNKLLATIMATTAFTLTLATVGILYSDSSLFRVALENDLSALAGIIADNSTGALAFEDAKVAGETLGALRARPHLIAACIYRPDASTLARYQRSGSAEACPPPRPAMTIWPVPQGLAVSRPIVLTNRIIGTLTLLYDLDEIAQRRWLYGGTVISIVLVSIVLGALFSSRLRSLMVAPVASLVETTQAVSESQDYGLRAAKMTGDEMGVLVDAFNGMLARIESRDRELKQLLSARDESNRHLTQLNEDLERFAFVASHDLREPLRMMTVYTQLLQDEQLLKSGPDSALYVSQVLKGTERMRELLDDLRTYAELGTFRTGAERADLNEALEHAQENLSIPIESSGAAVRSEALPAIRAYEGHLVSLFQNLIGNAIKYRSAAAPLVRVQCERQGDMWRFAIKDNGIGIAPQYQTQIFTPFERLHGAEIAGSGIGLAICKRVVERYGGRIWVESEPGLGATFFFTLPATDHDVGPERASRL